VHQLQQELHQLQRELHQLQQLQFKVHVLISMVQQGLAVLDLPLKAGAMVLISALQDMQQQWARLTQQL
jgi:hypothetical protein